AAVIAAEIDLERIGRGFSEQIARPGDSRDIGGRVAVVNANIFAGFGTERISDDVLFAEENRVAQSVGDGREFDFGDGERAVRFDGVVVGLVVAGTAHIVAQAAGAAVELAVAVGVALIFAVNAQSRRPPAWTRENGNNQLA